MIDKYFEVAVNELLRYVNTIQQETKGEPLTALELQELIFAVFADKKDFVLFTISQNSQCGISVAFSDRIDGLLGRLYKKKERKDVSDFSELDWKQTLQEIKRLSNIVRYEWVAECSDGCFYDESNKQFETKKECYEDMRNAALEKMKWNTQYDEDFADEECPVIGYEVNFSQNSIVHTSYSGIYTYKIVKC